MKTTGGTKSTRRLGQINRWDILVMGLVALTAFFMLLWPIMGRSGGNDTVEVSVDGRITVFSLLQDARHPFEGPDSPFVVTVENRTVRMDQAGCPDQLCVHQGTLRNPSGAIVCLPNKTIIRIPGESTYDEVSR